LIPPAHFELREDGEIVPSEGRAPRDPNFQNDLGRRGTPPADEKSPRLIFQSDNPFIRLYHGNSLELLDAIAAKYPEGRFDAIFADPPYFLSNGGIIPQSGTK